MKNIKELRNDLIENYEKMKTNEMRLKTGKELANVAGKILTSIKLELDYNKLIESKKRIKFLEYKDKS